MVDARGYSCPMPVIMVQKAVKDGAPQTLEVLVDNRCSLENVTRFANNQGYSVTSSQEGEDFRLVLEETLGIVLPGLHVPGPDAGKWRSSGWIQVGDTLSLAWRVLDAQYWGVPQRRRRIFLVADFGGLRAREVLFIQESLPGYTAPGPGAWKAAARAFVLGAANPGGASASPVLP